MREVAILPLVARAVVVEVAVLLLRPSIGIARAACSTTFASALARGPALASILILVGAATTALVLALATAFALALAFCRKSRATRGRGQTILPILVILLLTVALHQALHVVDEVLVGLLLVVVRQTMIVGHVLLQLRALLQLLEKYVPQRPLGKLDFTLLHHHEPETIERVNIRITRILQLRDVLDVVHHRHIGVQPEVIEG